MRATEDKNLKEQVREYWNRKSCGTDVAAAAKFSRDYFEEVESFRYKDQPFIHSFAQFTRYHEKRVLEVGFGAGTDFIQWLRAGAIASGIDLTQEGLDNLTHRIRMYGLPAPESIRVADAENLPFESNSFDLGYSFGVLHHTPDTERAIAELVRVVRPGGEIKIMLYNIHSLCVFKLWVKQAVLRGRPWRSWRSVLWHHMESIGTKGFSRNDLKKVFSRLPLGSVQVRTEITAADDLAFSAVQPLNSLCRALIRLAGYKPGWRRGDYFPGAASPAAGASRKEIEFLGNRFGWFHCISATRLGSKSIPADI